MMNILRRILMVEKLYIEDIKSIIEKQENIENREREH
jgi:hypothetical protein